LRAIRVRDEREKN